jgi:HPt (histidine-containing phosphotransfer) domain-containing protein
VTGAEVFDLQRFQRLTLGDPNLQRQLLSAFVRQLSQEKSRLARSARASEGEFQSALHRLKGSCALVAAARLMERLTVLEQGAGQARATRQAAARAVAEDLVQLEDVLGARLRSLE